MAQIDAARGAAGAHTALGLILMLLTQLLSASSLAVPQLTYSTTSNTRRDSITQQQQQQAKGAFSGRNQNNNNNNHKYNNHHPHHQQQPQQLIKKITNWSEKPPDTSYNIKLGVVQTPKRTKDLLIPLKSHFFENLIKRTHSNNLNYNNNNSYDRSQISRRSTSTNNNSTENLNVYFAINRTNESNLVSEQQNSDKESYFNPIRLHSDTGTAYFNDASIQEAKNYNAYLQHFKNDKSTNPDTHEMYQKLSSTTNNQQQQSMHTFINNNAQTTDFNQKISATHDYTSTKLGKYSKRSYERDCFE